MSKKYRIIKMIYDNEGVTTTEKVLAETNSFLYGIILLRKLFNNKEGEKYGSSNFRTEVGSVVKDFGRKSRTRLFIKVHEINEMDWCFLRVLYALQRN